MIVAVGAGVVTIVLGIRTLFVQPIFSYLRRRKDKKPETVDRVRFQGTAEIINDIPPTVRVTGRLLSSCNRPVFIEQVKASWAAKPTDADKKKLSAILPDPICAVCPSQPVISLPAGGGITTNIPVLKCEQDIFRSTSIQPLVESSEVSVHIMWLLDEETHEFDTMLEVEPSRDLMRRLRL